MTKDRISLLVAVLASSGLVAAAAAEAQRGRVPSRHRPAARHIEVGRTPSRLMTRGFPAPGLIKLCAPITVSTTVATEISPDPVGTSVDLGTAFVAVLKVT